MTNMRKRLIAFGLIFVMLVAGIIPSSLHAEEVTTENTSEAVTTEVTAETESTTTEGTEATTEATEQAAEAETEEVTEEATTEVTTEEATGSEENAVLAASGALQTIISEAEAGAVIQLGADYTEDIVIASGVNVTIDLYGHTLAAAGTNKSVITVYGTLTITDSYGGGAVTDADGFSNIRGILVAQGGTFTLESGTISGFSVSGNGGGVLVETGGTFTMTGGTICDNAATIYGGGVFLYDADQTKNLTGGTISGNSARSGGGLSANVASNSDMTLPIGLTISGNTASSYGGGVYYNGTLSTLNISSTINGNTSGSYGGGVYFGASVSTLNITDAIIDGNTAGAAGGGAYFAIKVPSATISGSSISSNKAAGNGGGVWFTSGTNLTFKDSDDNTGKINGNEISGTGAMYGAGIYLNSANDSTSVTYKSSFTSDGGEISDNILTSEDSTSSYGGGIYIGSYASISMTDTTVSGNTGATLGGGIAIYTYAQSITLTDLKVSENKAEASATANSGYGGGVYIADNSQGDIKIVGGTYIGNEAAYNGGGIFVKTSTSSLVISDAATFDGNTTYNAGGGIYTEGLLTLSGGDENSVIKIWNNVVTNGTGGGAYANTSTSYAITATGYVDVYNNSAGTNGGGLSVNSGGMDLSGHVTIRNNNAKGSNYGGGGIYAGGNTAGVVWLHAGVYIYENTCNLSGGGVYARYELDIDDGVEIYDNTANNYGGGVVALWLKMSGGKIHNNYAANAGGVHITQGTTSTLNPESIIYGGEIYENTAKTGSGGGVYVTSSPNILCIKDNAKIYDNTAYAYGGGVYCNDRLYFYGGIITGNTAQRGGGVYIAGNLGQNATITIADGSSGIIYDNTATAVNYGNDLGMCYSTTVLATDNLTSAGNDPLMSVGAASTFKDTENEITGVSWYDEVNDTTKENAFEAYSTGSSQTNQAYYTLIYATESVVAEVYNLDKTAYDTFPSVQEAVNAVATDSSKYGTKGSSDSTITIIMLDDSREDVDIPEGLTVTLDLAGCTLTGLMKSVITVEQNADLTIIDTSTEGTGLITGGDGTNYCYESKNEKYYNCGGGLLVIGTVTFEGGTISGNTAQYGGGVYVAGDSSDTANIINGIFVLAGGTITGNTATNNGGGLCVWSGYGSGGYKNATTPNFTMTSGSITANKGGSGGGVYICICKCQNRRRKYHEQYLFVQYVRRWRNISI